MYPNYKNISIMLSVLNRYLLFKRENQCYSRVAQGRHPGNELVDKLCPTLCQSRIRCIRKWL